MVVVVPKISPGPQAPTANRAAPGGPNSGNAGSGSNHNHGY